MGGNGARSGFAYYTLSITIRVMKKHQLSIAIGIVVAFLVVGVVAWYTLPSGMNSTSLIDGEQTSLGVFHDLPVENGVKAFTSDELSISFSYPDGYLLFQREGMLSPALKLHALMITPEASALETIECLNKPGCNGHLPASIYFSFYQEPSNILSLEDWIRTKSHSNFDPSDPAQVGILTPTTVAGIPAFRYQVRGLYDFEYITFRHGEWIVLGNFPHGMDEKFSRDFQTILFSIRLR